MSAPQPVVLHQPPGVEALAPASQAQTHSPPSPTLAEWTDDWSPTVESTPLLTTNRSPTVKCQSPTVHSPIPVTKEAINANTCSHSLLPKCLTCGNCICCTILNNKQPTDSVKDSPGEGSSFSQQLTIDIPLIAPLYPTLKSPLSNTSLNTPVVEFSPVSPASPVPQALFTSGTNPDKGHQSPFHSTGLYSLLVGFKYKPH